MLAHFYRFQIVVVSAIIHVLSARLVVPYRTFKTKLHSGTVHKSFLILHILKYNATCHLSAMGMFAGTNMEMEQESNNHR